MMIKKCLPLILIVTLYGCADEEGCTDPSALNYNSEATNDNGSCTYATTMIENIKIEFTQTVNGNPLTLNDMIYTNQANDNYSIQTVRYLISDITLHTDDNSIILDEVHFIDISIDSTLNLHIESIADVNYNTISFTMGLDSSKNITDLFLNENFFPSFSWPTLLGGGYHYMQLEGDYNSLLQGYATHTGPTNGTDYSFNKIFPITTSITSGSTININMEINNWYSNPNIFNLSGGIMDNQNAQIVLQENGINDVFSVSIN